MEPALLIAVTIVVGLALCVLGLFSLAAVRRITDDVRAEAEADRAAAIDAAVSALRAEQGQQLHHTVDTVVSMASSKLGDQLHAGRIVIERERETVSRESAQVRDELKRVADLVTSLQAERAEQTGRLTTGLEQAVAVTRHLQSTTQTLSEALASQKTRGQWGERLAEDVLRAAGFVEGISYTKQRGVAGGGIPDFTFPLPHGREVHMDVKFPLDNYLRWMQAEETDRLAYAKAFKRDVRARVKELADRNYIDAERTVDQVLLFIPNEAVFAFVHEHDPELIDVALGRKVVLCSPTTLFAVLAVIRQAVDNFRVERRSDEILAALAGLRDQWTRYQGEVAKVGRALTTAQRAYEEVDGTRTRQFEKSLDRLEAIRDRATSELDAPPQPSDTGRPALREVV